MATPISKRQQARNERQLQDLIHNVPGNDRCADCSAKNPGWASWNLGIFLCLRCAALHRKLGTHISKVKSLSMDSWAVEQVDNMRKMGNAKSNATYNPRGVSADIPIDVDEVDGAMERYIRHKYEMRTLSSSTGPAARQNTGSTGTGSWNEEPPPLPPKPGKRFTLNFRSASSPFNRSKQGRVTPPMSPVVDTMDTPRTNKPSQLFGMKITTIGNNFDQKLLTLREMGFPDNKKNTEVLKSTNGSLDAAIETLIRLGEGNPSGPTMPSSNSRALTPISMQSTGRNGISVEKTRQPENRDTSSPWDVRDTAPQRAATQPLPPTSVPPRAQSAGPGAQSAGPSVSSWNPFLTSTSNVAPQQSLETSFQALKVSQTGPGQQQSFQQPVPSMQTLQHNNPFQPVPQYQYQPSPLSSDWQNHQQTATYPPLQQQHPLQTASPAAQLENSTNPFLRRSSSQTFTPSNPWASQSPPPPVPQISSHWLQSSAASPAPSAKTPGNPFGLPSEGPPTIFQQPTTASPAPIYGQQEYFQQTQHNSALQQSFPQPQLPQQSQHVPISQNPWQQSMLQPQQTAGAPQQHQFAPQQMLQQQSFSSTYQPQQFQQYSQPQLPSQPIRHDKTSILALYNLPSMSPSRPLQTLPEDSSQPSLNIPQRSATMPPAFDAAANTSMNPFGAPPPVTRSIQHVSNESVDFVGMGIGASGRHSPDAFSGLSSRYMR